MFSSGILRDKITIKRYKATNVDSRGQSVKEWLALYENIPAKVEKLSGRELENARKLSPTATYKVVTRYAPGVNEKQQIIFQERALEISTVTDWENRQRWLVILAEEIT